MDANKRLLFTLAFSSVFILTTAALRPVQTMQAEYFYLVRYDKKPDCDVVIAGNSRADCDVIPEITGPICGKTYLFAVNDVQLTPAFLSKIPEKLNPEGKKIILFALSPNEFKSAGETKAFSRMHEMTPGRRKVEADVFRRFDAFDTDPAVNRRDDGYHELRYPATQRSKDYVLGVYAANKPARQDKIDVFAAEVKKLTAAGYTVMGCRFPTCPEMVKLEDEQWDYDAFRKTTSGAGMIWIDIDGEYETVDASHMTPDSARKFSKALAYKIKEIEDGKAR
ncbi:MAG: hypothetical protein IJT09_03505 [Abditibacteriota bacterium]|nr:hypothetical protein [Abditibacteriota bacterium]